MSAVIPEQRKLDLCKKNVRHGLVDVPHEADQGKRARLQRGLSEEVPDLTSCTSKPGQADAGNACAVGRKAVRWVHLCASC